MIYRTSRTLLAAIAALCALAPGLASAQQISIHAGRHGISVSDRWRGWHSRAEMFAHRHWDRRHRVWVYQYPAGYRHHWHR